ncbi:mitochondrial coenzyme A diphosphatase NUDT8-like [Leptidea sinapis]|uniref:mitochondrial coenzyme A diphosphatase NUDT8-like n=1 Tax=Leptidea sinapis TaxID=189913 RepID=UPI00213BB780|nr:mitochondrial coenzyme A diphosphatase NUDT8-like [Leptidea sinapis]
MSLSAQKLLSSAARERCVSRLRDQPHFLYETGIPKVKAGVLVPLCIVNDEVHILYTLRSKQLKAHKGQVSFPGGKMDMGEDIIETALRESEEEIGLPRESVDIWCEMSPIQGLDKNMLIIPVVGEIKNFDNLSLIPNEDEVEEIFTVPIQHLSNPENHAHLKYEKQMVPIFENGKHKIWGITGFITHLFLQCFLPSGSYMVDFDRKHYKINELVAKL